MTPAAYGPPDASQAPRYTGVRTFARCPHVDATRRASTSAVVGVPFDTATSYRPGARFGPGGDPRRLDRSCARTTRRSTSTCSRALSVVDCGDLDVTPGNAERTAGQIADGLGAGARAPASCRSCSAATTRSCSASCARTRRVHGPLALVLLDAHADTWDEYYGERYFHGTPFRRAVEEGLLRPERSLLAGHARAALRRARTSATRARWASS